MTAYIHFDLLEPQIFNFLFGHHSFKVREYFMSLVNNMASEFQGRSYLLNRQDMVHILINSMMKDEADSYFRQNTLGAL